MTTVYSRLRASFYTSVSVYPDDIVRQKTQTCLGINVAVNTLRYNNATELDPLRSLLTGTNTSNDTKVHLYTIFAIGNALQMLTAFVEQALPSPTGGTGDALLTAIYRRRALAAEAIVYGIASRCFTSHVFDVRNDSHWNEAVKTGIEQYLNLTTFLPRTFAQQGGANSIVNQCCVGGQGACCSSSCACNTIMLANAATALKTVNDAMFNATFGDAAATELGAEIVTDMAKIQFNAHAGYTVALRQMASGSMTLTDYRTATSYGALSANVAANTTFDYGALLLVTGLNPPAPPPPPSVTRATENFFQRKWPNASGLPVFIFLIFAGVLLLIVLVIIVVWCCISRSSAEKLRLQEEEEAAASKGPYVDRIAGAKPGAIAAVGDDGVIYLVEDIHGLVQPTSKILFMSILFFVFLAI